MNGTALSALTKPLGDFWHWWSGEIGEMIPARVKEAAISRNHHDLYLTRDDVVIESANNGSVRRIAAGMPLGQLDEESWVQIEEFLVAGRLRLFLPEDDILAVNISLPRKAASDLRSAIALQLPVHSPLESHLVDWDYFRSSETSDRVNVTLALARQDDLDLIEAQFAERGLMPPAIGAKLDDHILWFRKPLIIGDGLFASTESKLKAASLALLLSVPFTTVFGAEILTAQNRERASVIESDAGDILASWRKAQTEEQLRRRIAPITRKKSAVADLEELAKLLPKSYWLQSASSDGDSELNLEINAPANAKLVELFEPSQLFQFGKAIATEELDANRSLTTIQLVRR